VAVTDEIIHVSQLLGALALAVPPKSTPMRTNVSLTVSPLSKY